MGTRPAASLKNHCFIFPMSVMASHTTLFDVLKTSSTITGASGLLFFKRIVIFTGR